MPQTENENKESLTRCFIAVAIPEGIKNQLSGLQSKLKHARADVKWTRPNSIHITLRFLGYMTDDGLAKTNEAMAETVKNFAPFEVEVKGSGTFPERGRPRVIWVGLKKGEPELTDIFKKLEQELIKRGLGEADKPFKGHLTLGRIKTGKNIEKLVEYLEKEGGISFGAFEAGSICLFRSQLHPEGAIYTVLKEHVFRGEAGGK